MSMVGQVALGAARSGAGRVPGAGRSSVRRRWRIRCACRMRACATSPSSRRTSGGCSRTLSLVAGLRGDFYTVTTEATPGYDVAAVVAGAQAGDRSGDASGSERRNLRAARR